MSWDRQFDDPITLPDGRVLRTLRDAGEYIQALPQARKQAKEWQTACEALLLVVQHNGDPMHARMGMGYALNNGKPNDMVGTKASRQAKRWAAARATR